MPVILARASQQAAGYRPEGGVERCGYCRFFVSQGTCNRILGPVSPRGWCRYFSREIWLRMDGGDADIAAAIGPPGVTLDLNFMAGTMPSGITFSRASTASYFNSAGMMQTAAANVARFDYNPNTLALNGLLIEEARTNVVTYSLPTSTNWTLAATTLAANSITAPDGTTTASLLSDNATSAAHATATTATFSFVFNTTYSFSVFAKAATSHVMQIYTSTGPFTTSPYANFDLTAGTVGTSSGIVSASMQNCGNGWWRCVVAITANANSAGAQFSIALTNDNSSAARIVSYVGTGKGFYVWGAQTESGAFPTSYIPTTGAAVTRSADVASMPIGAWYNTTVGSLVSENTWSGRNPAAVFPRIVQLDNGTNSFTISHLLSGSNGRVYSSDTISGTTGWAMGPNGIYAANTLFKLGTTWQAGAQTFALNAGNQTTSAQAALPTGLTTLRFGADASGPPANQALWLQRVRYWPRILSNAELLSVTT